MAEKGFGVKEIKFVGSSPKIESLSNLDLSATTVAISTNATVGGNLTVSGNVSVGGTLTYEDVTNVDSVGVITAREGIFLPDNKSIHLGNVSGGGDLQLYHTGSESYIKDAGTGRLRIQSSQLCLQSSTGENFLVGNPDAATVLYHNNVSKIETTSTGIKVDGDIRVGNSSALSIKNDNASETLASFNNDGSVQLFYDNSQKLGTAGWGVQIEGILKVLDSTDSSGATNNLTVGTGSDLKLFHDANHSYIKNSTGQLSIENTASNISIKASDSNADFILRVGGSTSSENAIVAVHNGEVILSFNGNTKLTTTNSGVTVTGGVTADGFTLGDNEIIQFGDSNDLRIFHNGSHSYIADIGTGDLRITGSAVHIQDAAQSENMIRCFENGAVELYYDNSRKIETHSTGGNVIGSFGVNTTTPASTIDARADSGAGITARNTGTAASIAMYVGSSTNQLVSRGANVSTARDLIFMLGSTTAIRIDSNGHLRPETDSTFDLGSNTVRWRNFYADTLYGSGANLTNLPAPTPATTDIQVVYEVTASGSSAYLFSGNGVSGSNNEDLYLIRGKKYRFINNSGGSHPFEIRSSSGGSAYNTGVTNNGAASGNIDFAPSYDSPSHLYYQCTSHGGMVGNIYITGGQYHTRPNNLCLQYTPSASINKTSGTIVYATEVFDVGDSNAYNTSNGEFTAPVTGVYRIQYEHFAAGAGRATTAIQKHNGSSWSTVKNGMRVYASSATGANWPSVPTIFYLQLNATEKFKIIHLEGTVHLNTPWNHLTVQLVQ